MNSWRIRRFSSSDSHDPSTPLRLSSRTVSTPHSAAFAIFTYSVPMSVWNIDGSSELTMILSPRAAISRIGWVV